MSVIGLDLGARKFRAVEIEKGKGSHVLSNFGAYEGRDLDLNFSNEDHINKYAQQIKEFMREHNFGTSHVISAIPERDVFIQTIETPVMNQKDLNNFIELGSEEYIPDSLENVTFSAQIIGKDEKEDKSNKSSTMNVLLVASKNDVLNRYVNVLKLAGLTPAGLEPETLSIERVLGDTAERPNASLIVNIGLLATQIIVSYRGYVRFTRSLSLGGEDLTKAVEKELNLDFIQAEEYKKAYGLDESQVESKVFNAIKPVFDKILNEINRSKTYYTTHNQDVMINRVILSGGTALMPGLLLYIANKLDVEAELANPWRNVRISEKIKTKRKSLMESGPLYASAVGLALKEI